MNKSADVSYKAQHEVDADSIPNGANVKAQRDAARPAGTSQDTSDRQLIDVDKASGISLHTDNLCLVNGRVELRFALHDPFAQVTGFGLLQEQEPRSFVPLVHGLNDVDLKEITWGQSRSHLNVAPWTSICAYQVSIPYTASQMRLVLILGDSGAVLGKLMNVLPNQANTGAIRAVAFNQNPLVSVYSLDFFDTLFWRRHLNPTDLFIQWGCKLIEETGSTLDAASLATLRVEAERDARERSYRTRGSWEVSLEQIYASIPDHIIPKSFIERAMDLEINIEADVLIPDLRLFARLHALKAKGNLLVLCSDTYLPRVAFERFMQMANLSLEFFDNIYLSHEHALPKEFGLIRKIAEDCKVTPDRVTHIGDNIQYDVHGGRMVGVKVEHFAPVDDYLATIERGIRKLTLLSTTSKPYLPSIDGVHGYARRFVQEYSSQRPLDGGIVGYGFGPLFFGYFSWLFEQARLEGRSVVLFPTREGITLTRMFNAFKAFFYPFSPLRCLHLPVSRKALDFADLESDDLDIGREVERYFYNRKTPVSAATFAKLIAYPIALSNLDLDDFYYPIRNGDARSVKIVSHLLQCKLFLGKLRDFSHNKRKNTMAFFQSYFTEHKISVASVLIADVGWSGGIFRKLCFFLQLIDSKTRPVARYVFVDERAANLNLRGFNLRGFVSQLGGSGNFGNITLNSKEILEQFLTPPVSSINGFSQDGEPIRGAPAKFSTKQLLQKEILIELTISYFDFISAYKGQLPRFSPAVLELLMARLYAYPTEQEVESLGMWAQDDNYAEHSADAIPSHTLIEHSLAAGQRGAVLDDFFRIPNYWTFGASALYRPKDHDAIVMRAITGEWGSYTKGDREYRALISIERRLTDGTTKIDKSFVQNFYVGPGGYGMLRFRFYTDFSAKVWIENLDGSMAIQDCLAEVSHMERNEMETFKVSDIEQAEHGAWHHRSAIGLGLPAFDLRSPREVCIYIAVNTKKN